LRGKEEGKFLKDKVSVELEQGSRVMKIQSGNRGKFYSGAPAGSGGSARRRGADKEGHFHTKLFQKF
jgi:hypothetical protein